jgi:hypothetical protein
MYSGYEPLVRWPAVFPVNWLETADHDGRPKGADIAPEDKPAHATLGMTVRWPL